MAPPNNAPVVGIDASRMTVSERTGTENYSDRIIRDLMAEDVPWRWRLYANAYQADFPIPVSNQIEIRTIPARRLWTHYRLSRDILVNRPDLLFVPAHVVPLVHPRTVVTIHDLGYLHYPDTHPPRQRRMLDITTRWSAKVAKHIIVPSNATRDDLITCYGVPPERISTVHHGVDDRFHHADRSHEPDIRARYALARPFILVVGTIQPRKNLPALARALARSGLDHDLVIAGKPGWMSDQVMTELIRSGLGARIRTLGYVPDADLPDLYAAADLFVQPSHFEGFGMPVLEAMATGTPVICASGSSLNEIAGTGAEFFDPDDSVTLASLLVSIVTNPDRKNELSHRGRAWSSRFTWERAAQETRSILERTLI